MRAISLLQPWASQVFDRFDPKNIENRNRLQPPLELLVEPRPYLAIHASLGYDKEIGKKWSFPKGATVPGPAMCPRGAIIGVVRVRGSLDNRGGRYRNVRGIDPLLTPATDPRARELLDMDQQRWWLGPIGWLFFDGVGIRNPVPCKGSLGVWTVPADVEVVVCSRLATQEC